MLPPSDSLLHHAHKLSEAAANIDRNDVRPTPPPPYSSAAQHNAIHEDIESELAGDEDRQAPLAIYVDASINVSGDGNSIVLPPSAAEAASPSSSASAGNATAHAAPRQRQTRLTDMTASILTALHRTGLLNAARTSTPVEIHVTTGIKIEGSRNIICSGSVANRPLVGKRHAPGDEASRKRRSQSEPTEVPGSSKRHCSM
ncbi:hypothetical protein P170DRAFT_421066 [Aspergillus steynii IBT 23096]|uniref:Uncharacterized protein n=1 Tax=Aspergillus steynii IBT 23096 TaxID=1392250 RepID=A0A2I2GN86_9EURO|nr:uncharacterized protein P170DRAFT_421066 [Aspergillus steynii IBT 23096]PLB54333.1 hypothetical protein P170DRAFT_421066 [Aspergillus steynii IBT 23096]